MTKQRGCLIAPEGYFDANPILQKTRKAAKAEAEFDLAVVRHLRTRYAATPPVDAWIGFTVETSRGRVTVRPRGTWIAIRVEDPGKYPGAWQMNPCSGKWNIHMSVPDLAANLAELDRRLSQ